MKQTLVRFARYVLVGGLTFVFDLGMLYVAVNFLHIQYYIATFGSFLIAVSCNYVVSRNFVFKGTERSWHHGYAYFAMVALAGAAVTTGAVTLLVSLLGLYYLFARVIVAGIIGIGNYLFNLHVNFKVTGIHTS